MSRSIQPRTPRSACSSCSLTAHPFRTRTPPSYEQPAVNVSPRWDDLSGREGAYVSARAGRPRLRSAPVPDEPIGARHMRREASTTLPDEAATGIAARPNVRTPWLGTKRPRQQGYSRQRQPDKEDRSLPNFSSRSRRARGLRTAQCAGALPVERRAVHGNVPDHRLGNRGPLSQSGRSRRSRLVPVPDRRAAARSITLTPAASAHATTSYG
jgi:hypothetical protein